MIVFDLECRAGGHRFEGWFGSSEDYTHQQERGFVTCPECGGANVIKAPMAPHLARKSNQRAVLEATPSTPAAAQAISTQATAKGAMAKSAMPPEAVKMLQAMATMQAEALKQSTWVGDTFAEDARAMHYGEREAVSIHGQATIEEAKELWEEGIEVAPLPFPVAPPGDAN
jgi:hypothetical protein